MAARSGLHPISVVREMIPASELKQNHDDSGAARSRNERSWVSISQIQASRAVFND